VNSTREFEEMFSWRKDRWIHNLDELVPPMNIRAKLLSSNGFLASEEIW
jgi:hypothetical protein